MVDPQEILTKDSVTVSVDAVVYHRVYNPLNAVVKVNLCTIFALLREKQISSILISNADDIEQKKTNIRWPILVAQPGYWLHRCYVTF